MGSVLRTHGPPFVRLLLLLLIVPLAVSCKSGAKSGTPDPVCGNAILEDGEACDDGLAGLGPCTAQCEWQEFTVEPEPAGSLTEPQVAVSSEGQFVVVYQKANGDGSGFAVFGVVYDRNGELLWGPERLNTITDDNQWFPRVAVGPDGSFVAVWENGPEMNRDIYVRWFMAGNWAQAEVEQQVNQHSAGDHYFPSVAWLPGGGAVVAWSGDYVDGDSSGVLARMYGTNRQPLGEEFVVNTFWENEQTYPSVASTPDGSFLIVWESKCQESG